MADDLSKKRQTFLQNPQTGKMFGSTPSGKITEVPADKIIPSTDEMKNAIDDVKVGKVSPSGLPILVRETDNGMFEILDGHHRFAKEMNYKDTVKVMTDEKEYRRLADLEAKLLPIRTEVQEIRSGGKLGDSALNRDGEWIDMTDVVARERFNIPELKKLSFGGSDRDVYELANGNVLKIAKTRRGLAQNQMADWFASSEGLIPEIKEIGKNYVVFEKVAPPDANVKKMVAELKKVGTPMKFFRDNAGRDAYYAKIDEFIAVMEKYGYPAEELRNYGDNLLWGDFSAIRNWGTKDGVPIHLDEGSLNGSFVQQFANDSKQGIKNMNDPQFREIYTISKKLREKFGDLDGKTMYGLTGLLVGSYGLTQQ
jgi:thiol-disulfide isomerase/thioredoxin